MLSHESEIDAQFYEMIHRLGEGTDASPDERRSESRHAYDISQKVAPYDGHCFPAPDEFIDVQCHDLTRAGFSFLLSRRPSFTSIVVLFQGPNETLHFEAEVVQVRRALLQPNGEVEVLGERHSPATAIHPEAKPALLVGCRLVRRLQPE